MFAVRFHGRGGQGVVTAAELLAAAAFSEGRHAQAFPSFGSERMGAPVMSFCRIDDKPIRTHEPVTAPDALLIQDATLLRGAVARGEADLFAGLKPGGYVLLNSARDPGELGLPDFAARHAGGRLRTLPASNLAMTYLGRPLPGAPMLAGLAALTGVVSLDAVLAAIGERFTGTVAAGNAAAARAAFEFLAGVKTDA